MGYGGLTRAQLDAAIAAANNAPAWLSANNYFVGDHMCANGRWALNGANYELPNDTNSPSAFLLYTKRLRSCNHAVTVRFNPDAPPTGWLAVGVVLRNDEPDAPSANRVEIRLIQSGESDIVNVQCAGYEYYRVPNTTDVCSSALGTISGITRICDPLTLIGDLLKFQILGNRITAWVNGVPVPWYLNTSGPPRGCYAGIWASVDLATAETIRVPVADLIVEDM
jgi:hypothetical protein